MPRAILVRRLALASILAVLASSGTPASAASAQVTIEVPQGKLKSVRLRHMPRGAQLAVSISASGSLSVELVSKAQLTSKRPAALFRGRFDRKISFSLSIPESDDYYLVLDNRSGAEAVSATATIQARGVRDSPRAPPATPKGAGKLDQTRAAGAALA